MAPGRPILLRRLIEITLPLRPHPPDAWQLTSSLPQSPYCKYDSVGPSGRTRHPPRWAAPSLGKIIYASLLIFFLTCWACRENQPPPEIAPASPAAVPAVTPEATSAVLTTSPVNGSEAQCNPSRKQTGKGCDMAGIILAISPLREPGAAIPACYLKHVQPPTEGKLVLRFALTPDGKAGGWQWPQDDFGSQPLRSCLEASVSTVQFPLPGDKPCQVVYPFTFIPEVRRVRP